MYTQKKKVKQFHFIILGKNRKLLMTQVTESEYRELQYLATRYHFLWSVEVTDGLSNYCPSCKLVWALLFFEAFSLYTFNFITNLLSVRKYDNAVICGLVWTANFVAYRCRTCGISPCMSLCADCFQAGNHEGHDFNMFRSQAGGACDCGDVSVMKKEG